MNPKDPDGPCQVLVVDDEAGTRLLLRRYLEREGYRVLEAEDGAAALRQVRDHQVDLALVDVMMPTMDGFELVRRLRAQSDLPLILLTGRGEETSRVTGLELGADDYVVKPYSVPELVARVRARLRRPGTQPDPASSLDMGPVHLDTDSRRAWVHDAEVELTRREFDLLAALLANPGRVYTREQLLERAWGTTYVSSKTVDVHLSSLRRKLGASVRLRALRGVGYRAELP